MPLDKNGKRVAAKKSKGLYGVDTKADQVRALKREKSIKARNEKAGVRPVGGSAKPSRLPETSKVPSVGLSRAIQTHSREAMPTAAAGRRAVKAVKVAPEGGRFNLKPKALNLRPQGVDRTSMSILMESRKQIAATMAGAGKKAAPHALQRGKKGGTFYVVNGRKVYAKK